MSHARQQIRDAVTAALVSVTATVQKQRIWVLQQDELPLVGVYTSTEEDSLDEGASFGTLFRSLEVKVDLAVAGSTGEQSLNDLDDLAVEVETDLGADRQLVNIMELLPVSTDVEQTTEGDSVISRMTMTFEAMYRTEIGKPEVII